MSSINCSCFGSLTFNSANQGSCSCPSGNIILADITCQSCPNNSVLLTPYECLCSSPNIWIYATKTCVACGSNDIPNSLSTGGTNLACVCTTGYIWDVMTQSCILSSSCLTGARCMKCPSGNATALNSAKAKNFTEGTTVKKLLNGTFTNYNLLKDFQCSCSAGLTWDLLRLQCFDSRLQ